MSLVPAGRVDAIQAPIIPIIGQWIRANPGTISLGQGVVHYGPPPSVLERVQSFATERACDLYQPDEGMVALTDAIAAKVASENGIDMSGRRVVVTAGANMGFMNTVFAIADPGDEIIVLAPYYFNHEMAISLAGCRTVAVPTDARYRIDLDAIRAHITARTKAIVTVSPNNPTGVAYSPESLMAVNALCAERGIYHVTDEAYEYFVYDDDRHYSPGAAPGSEDHTISLFSLSKSYGFAGWRIGYMIIPQWLFEPVLKIQDTNIISATSLSQFAALACLEEGRAYCAPFVEGLDRVRGQVFSTLRELDARIEVPDSNGAFYAFVRLHSEVDDRELVKALIERHRVAVVPGSTFGAPGYLRVSYGALDEATVAEGMGRLSDGLLALNR